ncbi:hypothetical protein MMRN_38980 [Mycobacterium marinum]|uniref:hypothetical protein n=1 Tax=Mycobacterium marinum TaxID=1781 RepID=UPI000CD8C49C|nr:hypothetical protein [Mycobacterium marinum]AXN50993.1 hypothetical protein CCUG20998_03591 [Mycobacterium marinum]RFZ25410.1 hypothetical protein DSM43519_01596 [Mycobacterium marinum]RFZ28295.1 hypothetical protein DSM44344_01340 [Mycobacterium marinum]WOR03038.1 hypothetical protein QDR78_17655 [Mycobacterium marinum]BBC67002.1 hypothetical protein MMRN_38980 [Mycobacterium marinum]
MTTPRRSPSEPTDLPGGITPGYAEAIAAVSKSQDELSRCRANAPSGTGGMTGTGHGDAQRHGVTTAYWDGYQLTVKSWAVNIRAAFAVDPEGGAR